MRQTADGKRALDHHLHCRSAVLAADVRHRSTPYIVLYIQPAVVFKRRSTCRRRTVPCHHCRRRGRSGQRHASSLAAKLALLRPNRPSGARFSSSCHLPEHAAGIAVALTSIFSPYPVHHRRHVHSTRRAMRPCSGAASRRGLVAVFSVGLGPLAGGAHVQLGDLLPPRLRAQGTSAPCHDGEPGDLWIW